MGKIIDIKELAYCKSYEKDFEDFVQIWAEYWKEKDPLTLLYRQIMTSTRLLQLAIIADSDFEMLDKDCKKKIICELKATINMLK